MDRLLPIARVARLLAVPTTLDHLRRTILEHPFQDEPRLIYADALSETGRPEDWDRADAIREHVARPDLVMSCLGDASVGMTCPSYTAELKPSAYGCPVCERFEADGMPWDFLGEDRYVARRGFVSDLVGPLDRILAELGLWAIHPVIGVTVTDKTPSYYGVAKVYTWWREEGMRIRPYRSSIPGIIWHRLRPTVAKSGNECDYRSEAEAYIDLSRAIVAEGRHLAGLPPIVWPQS